MKTSKPSSRGQKPDRATAKKALKKERVDQLGVTRGQNAEQGNTVKENQIRDEGLVSH